jgi:hypothetical protein
MYYGGLSNIQMVVGLLVCLFVCLFVCLTQTPQKFGAELICSGKVDSS